MPSKLCQVQRPSSLMKIDLNILPAFKNISSDYWNDVFTASSYVEIQRQTILDPDINSKD